MGNSWLLYRCMVIGICLMILFLFGIFPYLISKAQMVYITLNPTVDLIFNVSDACKNYHTSRLDAPKDEFDIKIHEKLRICLQPENDSRQLSVNLDFMWRRK